MPSIRQILRTGRWPGRTGTVLRVLLWGARLLVLLLVLDAFYLYTIWPDWKALARGPVPKSNFMRDYQQERGAHPDWPSLHWQTVALSAIPKYLQRSVILAEDVRFYGHGGFDLEAFREAMGRNLQKGRFAFGASTISQQTVKNLFLSSSRNPLRKWHELILTWGMERNLSKARILELYLNVAEFGRGVYGVQAAARHYWGVDVGALPPPRAAELAATLPSPIKNNPLTRPPAFEKRAARVYALLLRFPGDAAESLAGFTLPAPLPATELLEPEEEYEAR